jgi:inward rectifier potassium channel
LRAIERRGLRRRGLGDLYHTLMTIDLTSLLAALAGTFLVINIFFAAVYFGVGGLAGVRAGTFFGAFFFSVQTLSTTGYGAIYPVTLTANFLAVAEMLLGLLSTALATGVLFARLSRPRARVMFSKVVIIRQYRGAPTLMFRLANERRNQILEARVSVTATYDEADDTGSTLRRLIPLQLERETTPVFALTWLVMHRITEDSPLFGKDMAAIAAAGNVIVCSFTGLDDTLNAPIYARHVYGAEDLRIGHQFVDVMERRATGDITIDYGKFHETVAAADLDVTAV